MMAKYVVTIPDAVEVIGSPVEWVIKHALMCKLKLKNDKVWVQKMD